MAKDPPLEAVKIATFSLSPREPRHKVNFMTADLSIPKAFIWRRLHSLTGLFFSLYLFEHLLVNSQAALWIGDDGSGFVRAVNSIQELPYLHFIEIFLLGVPILIHMAWGIHYLQSSAPNSWASDGTKPSLPEYPRNRAYTWQRITSWLLLVGVIAHVIQMRIVEYPVKAGEKSYMVRLNYDKGLETLAPRLNFKLLDAGPLKPGQKIAVAPNFGTAELLMVRETFKWPLMLALYTVFVLSACFHGFNGFWSFMIRWGVTLNVSSQRLMRIFSTALMALVAFWGLAAIWGTYWINLLE